MQGSDPECDDAGMAVDSLIRELRQRIESLQRAGLRDLPRAKPFVPVVPAVQDFTAGVGGGADSPPDPQLAAASESATMPPPASADRSAAARSVSPADPSPRVSPAAAPVHPAGSLFQESGFDSAPVPLEQRLAVLQALADEVAGCRKCTLLAETRTQTVFADGSPSARLMFVGEAPGADEDRIGRPFVGRAGQLLTDMITKGMGLNRQNVYIANILKCRPPENREPSLEESANCLPYLERQIQIVRPEFLCLLGRTAVQGLLGTTLSMGRLRGKWYRYKGIPTLVTYHPSYLLRNPAAKKDAWEDLQLLMNAMGLPLPSRRKNS